MTTDTKAQGKGRVKPDRPPVPWWGWAFVVGCTAIPVLTLGGAVPGAIGFGGAGACYSVARHPDMTPAARAGVCAAITLACYTLVVTILGGLALLAQ